MKKGGILVVNCFNIYTHTCTVPTLPKLLRKLSD